MTLAKEQLRRAKLDAAVFELLIVNTDLVVSAFFHAEQAIERAFESVLASKEIPYAESSYELPVLFSALQAANLKPPIDNERVIAIQPFAVDGRYRLINNIPDTAVVRKTVNDCLAWATEQITK